MNKVIPDPDDEMCVQSPCLHRGDRVKLFPARRRHNYARKVGVFMGYVRPNIGCYPKPRAKVMFDGNKTISVVAVDRLRQIVKVKP